jgi:TRAP-type C4-dicarboxylate transport system permease small subunit
VFKSIKKVLDRSLEVLVMVVVAVLVVDVLWQVFTRFAPRIPGFFPKRIGVFVLRLLKLIHAEKPSFGTEEMAVFMLIWVSLLGAAVALNRGAHLGIDYFVGKLSPRKRLYTEVFVFLCISLFSFTVMVLGGIDLVASTLQLQQESPALQVKVGYVYLAIPISGFFLVLYSVIGLVERLAQLFKGGPTSEQRITQAD